MIQEHKIQSIKTARYYTLGKFNKNTKAIWFVFHGYGQLAKNFLNKFKIIDDESNIIIAVEALNRFYFRGFSGNVGASWMTKEAREDDIEDNVSYITSIYDKIFSEEDRSQSKVNVLGFSQGTHTAVRWMSNKNIHVDNLILWSGAFPHDISYSKDSEYWSTVKTKIILGLKDRMIDREKISKELEFFKEQNFDVELIHFDGGHEIDDKILSDLHNSFWK